ncbi:hypothetical protein HGM15179_001333 [Zosterops borbonicus]|uniref:Reverse transcriptase domain-containing protein n=1 Tax=Zosterops borbonicus TaxID=364589 RepID=A0A8K1GXA4_9PASS|nr:hypothetical protein HGM15179_001333 [Zosterops borbonicus]
MEHLILEAISIHMDDKKLIRSSQYGFTEGKSCFTNLTAFYGETATRVSEGRAVGIVYLDLSKAFDTISHNILVGKHMNCGLDEWTVGWIENWLNQRVIFSGTGSDWRPVTTGVPQALVWPYLECCAQYKRDMELLKQVQQKVSKMTGGLENLSFKERLKELCLFNLEERLLRGNLTMYKCLKRECQEDGTRLCSGVLSNKTRGNRQKLIHKKFCLNMRKKFFTVQVTGYQNRLPIKGMGSLSLEVFKNCLDTILCHMFQDDSS